MVIELKQPLYSLTPIVNRETPSKNIYKLRGRVLVKNALAETRYGYLKFSYFFSRFLPVFDNVDFLMKLLPNKQLRPQADNCLLSFKIKVEFIYEIRVADFTISSQKSLENLQIKKTHYWRPKI